ncbi:MAG: hypothetical protein KKF27_20855 [Gammaproteobacteria bacterium]|nr:hypothetical protein [Gammaproteobacteria bacterium]
MPAAVVTTGSTVPGLVPGLVAGLDGTGGGVGYTVMSVLGNPSGIVTPPYAKTIAIDATNAKFYYSVSGDNGNVWNQLGSVAFA